MSSLSPNFVTEGQYLEIERKSGIRSEYIAGRIYAMSGASVRHNLIAGNVYMLIRSLCERFGSLRVPAISGLSFGHIEQKLTLPIGVMATLDGDAGTLSIDEAAVTA